MPNLLFCPHTKCVSYVTNTFLLFRTSVRSKQLLCLMHGQGQKSEQKPTTKHFVGFHNHSPLVTILGGVGAVDCYQIVTALRCKSSGSASVHWVSARG